MGCGGMIQHSTTRRGQACSSFPGHVGNDILLPGHVENDILPPWSWWIVDILPSLLMMQSGEIAV